MNEIEEIKKELAEIKERNKRVEIKTCPPRDSLTVLRGIAKLENPFVNAIVPTMGFLLSTFSIPIFKNWWVKNK